MNKQSVIQHSTLCILHSAFCIAVAAATAATAAHGAAIDAMTTTPNVAMTSLSARQRFPWNGKVDIDFSFTCSNPDAYAFIQFKATYVDGAGATNTVPMKTFDQVTLPWCTNAGTYRVTWDSTADAPGLQVTNLRYAVTANMAKYMVVNLATGEITYMEECPDPTRADGGWTAEYKTTKMVFRLVQPGTSGQGWADPAFKDWNCTSTVTITFKRPFYLAVFECTQDQAKLINGGSWFGNQSTEFTGGNREMRPVSSASWNAWRGSAADGYCWPNDGSKVNPNSLIGKLRALTGCDFFDMPTESEWEYAARAGATDAWGGDGLKRTWGNGTGVNSPTGPTCYNTNTVLTAKARYRFNGGYIDNGNGTLSAPAYSSDETHGTAVVGSYAPNAWGFYDMQGNVRECTLDYFPYPEVNSPDRRTCAGGGTSATAATDPVGMPAGASYCRKADIQRVVKGGHWNNTAKECAFPYRCWDANFAANAQVQGCRIAWRFPYAP